MYGPADATLIVLSDGPLDQAVINALEASAEKLGHKALCVATLGEARAAGVESDPRDDAPAEALAAYIAEADPWAVVAIDDASVEALRAAFGGESRALAPDAPVNVLGYELVAAPAFAECLGDAAVKRVAWRRLQAARHPGNPLARQNPSSS